MFMLYFLGNNKVQPKVSESFGEHLKVNLMERERDREGGGGGEGEVRNGEDAFFEEEKEKL